MKNKFALCFRPVVIESGQISDSTTAVSKDIIVAKVKKNNGMVSPPSMSPSLLKNSGGNSVQIPPFPQPKNHSRKTLSRVLKTILFESPPRMRIQGGKIREITLIQEKAYDFEGRKTHLEKVEDHKRKREANIIREDSKIIPSISSSSSSPSSSSIGTSSLSLSSDKSSKDFKSLSAKRSLERSRSNTSLDKKKQAKITKTNHAKALDSSSSLFSSLSCEDKDMVLYWMVLALLSLILWGKIFAILLATLWLYFIIPCRRIGLHQHIKPENISVPLPEIETSTTSSREYEKKVIMEGLLERKPLLPHKALNL